MIPNDFQVDQFSEWTWESTATWTPASFPSIIRRAGFISKAVSQIKTSSYNNDNQFIKKVNQMKSDKQTIFSPIVLL